ncbi:rab GTPase-binding effector protein 1 isoform X1 [Poecilia reticulata]|uniref:Rab GTPase-binding effector protein 1 n=1 Tax=Poecilia reticulata TaxID=8081 RepID=A0A3P9PI11_POERE|nr:PREDICTED: rab GTPase-binding effector protein 1 isoform X1 [Poecilia reticulata]XP_008426751.1 PREDICTED: rab GTPase-binding effector protein 1 isoform X1 [Poecilia reticulata]
MAEEAEGSPLSSQHDEVLQQRVAALEQERAEFIRLKQQLEAEFNQKRAKFKELYLTKEQELKRQTEALENSQSELSAVQTHLSQAQAEIETIKAVATVSENTKQEAIDQVRSQWQEEVASLQAIMKDTVCEYEVQFHQRLEQERAQWNQYREAMERELGDLRRRLTEGQEEENLEDEMKKAQEDAEKLRSVVMPMEQEIAALKAKLSSTEDRVKELEASKVKELNHVLEAEKSCRTDLEMYVAVLNTQKSVLQEDAEKLRKELHDVCHKLELERQQHNQLKQTWQRANDQFLESQRLLMRDMQRIESVLSSEQLRQVEEMKKKDQEEDEKERLSLVKDLQEDDRGDNTEPLEDFLGLSVEEPPTNHSAHGSIHSLDTDIVAGGPWDPYKDNLRRVQSTDSLGSSLSSQQGLGGHNHKAKSASNLDESDFGPLVGADCGVTDSSFGETSSIGSIKLTAGHFLLTKDQEKAIKAMTPEQEETASLLSSISHAPDTAYLPPSGYRLVSDTEWNLLQQEVKNAGRKLGRRCDMCSNYEKQLQAIQGQEAETRDQVKKLQAMLRQANDQLERTMTEKQSLEESVKVGNEETDAKVSALMQSVQESEALLSTLQQAFSEAKRSTQEQMVVLLKSREQVADELSRLQRDNESLQGKHRLHVELQQQEDFQMPNTVQDLQGLVLQLRADVVALRTAADHVEEKLKAEILFLKEQIQAEQCLKENLEDTLQLEIEGCKEEIDILEASFSSLKMELERVKAEKDKLQSCLAEKMETLDSLQAVKMSLEHQFREVATAKSALESQVLDERDKAQRLQTELDVSEQVQKDFVKLSQTLQVQLERIRQAESLDRIKVILNDTNLTDINQLPET